MVYDIYKDCSELPLYNWVKIAVTGDFKWLVKTGETPPNIAEHYHVIYAEYQSLIKDTRSSKEMTLKIDMAKLANRIDHIQVCIQQLKIGRDEDIIRILRTPAPDGLGFGRLNYNILERDIKLTETYLQSDIVRYKQRKAQYDALLGEVTKGQAGEADFYQQISTLEKWKGSAIDVRTYTLIHWVADLNNLKAEIKANEKR